MKKFFDDWATTGYKGMCDDFICPTIATEEEIIFASYSLIDANVPGRYAIIFYDSYERDEYKLGEPYAIDSNGDYAYCVEILKDKVILETKAATKARKIKESLSVWV